MFSLGFNLNTLFASFAKLERSLSTLGELKLYYVPGAGSDSYRIEPAQSQWLQDFKYYATLLSTIKYFPPFLCCKAG